MRFHIEGMGVQGCLLAHFLDRAGHEFTWHDIHADQTAWRACTGAIYPSGSTKFGEDTACHRLWADWFLQRTIDRRHLEQSLWWFNHKGRPPHGGGYKATAPTEHGLRCAVDLYSYHFNAQTFVPETRRKYSHLCRDARIAGVKPGTIYLVSHGWGLRQLHVYWGWTRLVRLEYDPAIYVESVASETTAERRYPMRPAFYFREGRFIMAYAYPVPGTPYWYAGSSIIQQPPARARSLEIPPKYERWKRNFERLGGGAVRIVVESEFGEGWRPACRDDAWAQRNGDRVELRPLWNNGVRHFPQQLHELGKVLDLPELQVLA